MGEGVIGTHTFFSSVHFCAVYFIIPPVESAAAVTRTMFNGASNRACPLWCCSRPGRGLARLIVRLRHHRRSCRKSRHHRSTVPPFLWISKKVCKVCKVCSTLFTTPLHSASYTPSHYQPPLPAPSGGPKYPRLRWTHVPPSPPPPRHHHASPPPSPPPTSPPPPPSPLPSSPLPPPPLTAVTSTAATAAAAVPPGPHKIIVRIRGFEAAEG